MNGTARHALVAGSLAAGLAVLLGAFGAHALKARLAPEFLATWKTGVDYQLYHALGLLAVGLLAQLRPGQSGLRLAAGLMLADILMFSGSLYALALGAPRVVGLFTPLGGVSFILAWLLLAWCASAPSPTNL